MIPWLSLSDVASWFGQLHRSAVCVAYRWVRLMTSSEARRALGGRAGRPGPTVRSRGPWVATSCRIWIHIIGNGQSPPPHPDQVADHALDGGVAAKWFLYCARMRARPVGPAESSVFHNFARRGPTKEAHRRALDWPDGLLRGVAGRGHARFLRVTPPRVACCP